MLRCFVFPVGSKEENVDRMNVGSSLSTEQWSHTRRRPWQSFKFKGI